MNNKLSVGEKVKQVRLLNELSQKNFAETIGIKPPYLSEIENNKKEITSRILLSMREKFNVSVDWLLFSNADFKLISSRTKDKYTLGAVPKQDLEGDMPPRESLTVPVGYIDLKISSKLHGIETLYQRIIDIKLMHNKLNFGEKMIEHELSSFVDKLAEIKGKYFSDRAGFDFFARDDSISKFEDISTMTPKEKYEYLVVLEKNYNSFYEIFFSIFHDFYMTYIGYPNIR